MVDSFVIKKSNQTFISPVKYLHNWNAEKEK